jgi:hypothetical protein
VRFNESTAPDQSAYWWDFAHRLIGEYEAEFLAAAPHHLGLLDVCLGHGLTDLADCFQRCGLEYGSLFQGWRMGIFGPGMTWYPYATRCLYVLLLGTEGCRPPFETTVRDCATVGSWLRTHPGPPWTERAEDVSGFLDYIADGLTGRTEGERPVLGTDAYLGAAVLLLTSLEASREPHVERLVPLLGPLAGLAPYARARYGGQGDGLPGLPVPDGFEEILRAWARRDVDFVRHR